MASGKPFLIVLAVGLSTGAVAAPAVFVHPEPSTATWYDKRVNMRLSGKAVGRVGIPQVNALLAKTLDYEAYSICALQPVEPDTYLGLEAPTQKEVDEDLKGRTFAFEAATPDGIKLLVQAALFEDCQNERRGVAYMISNAATGEVYKFEPQTRMRRNEEEPAWVIYLYPQKRGEDGIFTYSLCSECDIQTTVYYDVTRRHFYEEYTGN